jgi:PAX-interacting protein 1
MPKGKRKKSVSPVPKVQDPAKKAKQDPQNNMSIPTPPKQQSTQPQISQASNPSQAQLCKPVKPIFVDSSLQIVRNLLVQIQFSIRPLCKVRGANSTQVSCFDINDKKILIEKLKSQSIGFHTFTEPSEKHRCFVLKGFFHTSCNELLDILQSSGVPAIKVTDLIRKDDFVFYLVHFADNVNINSLNHNHHTIDYVIVKWENLKRSSNKVTQCFNCQKFGHSSLNCGFPSRCVKCDGTHAKGSCPRTTREGDPKCVNCGGNHSANHRGCPVFKQHLERQKARPSRNQVPVHRSPASVPPIHQFPALSQSSPDPGPSFSRINSVSFAQKVKESDHNKDIFTKLSQAQNKLSSIPFINDTIDLFIKMVDELSLCNDHKDRLNILTKYSIQDPLIHNGN